MKLNKFVFIPILVMLTSFWFWRSVLVSIPIAMAIFTLSILTFIFFLEPSKLKAIGIILVTVILTLLIFREGFYRDIFYTNNLEKDRLIKRHEYYASVFGKLYENRIGLFLNENLSVPLDKYEVNFFADLDPNLYFFAGHPRERAGVSEFSKFSFLFLPFFLFGVYLFFKRGPLGISYFVMSIILSGFIYPNYFLGPILLFPFLIVSISFGIKGTLFGNEK